MFMVMAAGTALRTLLEVPVIRQQVQAGSP